MTTWAIVAVPSRLDPVWRVSSEKIPHMTLLYFGEQNSPELATKIEQFLGHAVETGSIGTFGARVESRGLLGDDDADVLFFPKDWHSIQKVQAFRQDLLKNPDVFRAYNSTMQYPEWTPHLTLGYPDSPAKDPDGVYPPLTWVEFDRIEFWTGDYEGPGFQLQDGHLELMYSEDVDNFLAHYGVKGMKWGRRKDKNSSVPAKTSRKKKIATLALAGLGGVAIAAGKNFVSSRSWGPVDSYESLGRVSGPNFDMSVEAYNYMRSMGLM